ncbi:MULTISPECIES: aromatic acid/H+ symport family MFS transporter [unclassified Streptomyces]|uniref:MFS transporter n=1 Tax=unclassified Streptomyces TaxID=2593676 RepID=UPI0023672D94|nr:MULTISPECIES: aromatic acid/H+ symport family MFS transporter [unclassified Streptomyces]MDF3145714.1 aromatic acid/H+ symport family MFS transporter [Streptomyces sp. T21Q-yed]WDF42357.1 aromatic acid/H+ symport family MFS transporter [Streptomyces sp. T12]
MILFDGYDLIVYGAVVPALLRYEPWGLTPTDAGLIGSYALIGMLVGALVAGAVTDLVGRRKVLLISVSWFSLTMAACALAPSAELFGLFRLLGGLGLGGVMPTAIALTAEYSAPHRRSLNNALMFSGYSVGGILSAVLALALLPEFGFRIMFWLGALPLVTVVPLLWRYLPESESYLAARGRTQKSKRGVAALFTRRHLVPAVLFAVTSFFGLLLVYGLNTWLPQIMKSAGYPLSSSLLFLVMMNVGAAVGSVLVAPVGDRLGMKPVTAVTFVAAAVSIYLLSSPMAAPVMYALVAVAGFGTIGTQIMVNAYVAMHFPPEVRATALGWTLGIGRLGAVVGPTFGGILLASDLPVEWNFYAFAIPAAAGSLMVFLLPRGARAAAAPSTDAMAVRA